ncbi:NB-ARC domain-containing protein [Amycolatopsis sp. cg5]|uniref:NB-ARC domain-containing protein n=1 Tax=Amycolatopsis sp. cg5 TaxID=3238802 RepID=UPI003523A12C
MLVPHEVPLGPGVFVNRERELGLLRELLPIGGVGRPLICICRGFPGVGKTAFVRHYVELISDLSGYPGGYLHVDFSASPSGEVVSVADALASCLISCGVAKEVIPDGLAARANLLRSRTAERGVMIVLDDVTDPGQVTPFVPRGAGSAVLVVTSSKLTELQFDGAAVVELEPLLAEDGVHLFTSLRGGDAADESAQVAELVRLCAGLPVALRVAAARLAARPDMRVGDLVAQIADEGAGMAAFAVRGVDKVSAVFAVTYGALPESAARLYRLLGLFPGRDLTFETATELAGPGDSAVVDLETLIESGLLTVDSASRLSLHPLLRRHASGLAEFDEGNVRSAALRRVLFGLLCRATFADLAVLGPGRLRCTRHEPIQAGYSNPFTGPEAKKQALAWFESERLNLMAAVRLAVKHGWNDFAWQLAEAMTALYVQRRYLVEWTESSDLGAQAAALAGNRDAEARLRSFASRAWTGLGDLARAERELVEIALPMAEQSASKRLQASVWELMGRFHDATDDRERAVQAYRRAIELFTEEGDARGIAFVLFFLGCSQEGAEALATLEDALPRVREVGDRRMEGRVLTRLGAVLDEVGEPSRARAVLESAVEVLVQDGAHFYEATAQELLGELAYRQQDVAIARSAFTRAAGLLRELCSPRASEVEERLGQLDVD